MPSDVAELPPKATPAVLPLAQAGKEPYGIKLSPCPGIPGTCPSDVPPTAVPAVPASPQTPVENPRQTLRRGRCLIHNWQEERATNHLDYVPGQELGNESYIYRHGHHGLLTHELPSSSPSSTTMKDAYRPPQMDVQLRRGQRESMLESRLYQKRRQAHASACHPPLEPCPGGGDPAAADAHGVSLHHAPGLLRQGPTAHTTAHHPAPQLLQRPALQLLAGASPRPACELPGTLPCQHLGDRLLTGTSPLPSLPGCHQHMQREKSLSEEGSLFHSH
ncbi:sperm-associated antigen 8 [Cuculus canorus]|uniref:sperm-associated antigen 8 n=1 Tax=Cuculus canorus TaxID=55661 RepID=UPI0023AA4B43|nr:sperm-associated antigen 8 [Cuculus canorus]